MENRYYFIFNESTSDFEAIQEITNNQFLGLKMKPDADGDMDYYSVSTLTEEKARQFFTVTGHLPSDKFEVLMQEVKENGN